MFSRHGVLQCIAVHLANGLGGGFNSQCFAVLSVGSGHRGSARSVAVVVARSRHQPEFNMRFHKTSLSVIGGDGVAVKCGPFARHRSMGSVEHMWFQIRLGWRSHAEWDCVSGAGVVVCRVCRPSACSCASVLFDVHVAIDALFGIGQGRDILRGVRVSLGRGRRNGMETAGWHAQCCRFSNCTHTFVAQLQACAGRIARADGSITGRARSQAIPTLIDIFRLMSSPDFMMFALLFHGVWKVV